MKNVSFIFTLKPKELFGQPNIKWGCEGFLYWKVAVVKNVETQV